MSHSTFPEALHRWVTLGIIVPEEAEKYCANYDYYEVNRDRIKRIFSSGRWWVGSVNQKIFAAMSLEEVKKLMEQEPDHDRADIIERTDRG